jgi:hypothetical protein
MQYAPPLADGKATDSAEDARDPCSGGGPSSLVDPPRAAPRRSLRHDSLGVWQAEPIAGSRTPRSVLASRPRRRYACLAQAGRSPALLAQLVGDGCHL